jgi:hypothetical protein
LAKGQPPLARLFPHRREWLYHWVRRICDRAGTQLICTHSLRGLHATLAIDAGITPPAVASALGHASVRATLVSYADASTVTHARQTPGGGDARPAHPSEGTPWGKTRGKDGPVVDPETTKGPAFLRDP